MQLPIINLNGTSSRQLLEDYLAATEALLTALEAVQNTCPNGRDYQTLGPTAGPEALHRAIEEHNARLSKIQQVISDLETLAEHVV